MTSGLKIKTTLLSCCIILMFSCFAFATEEGKTDPWKIIEAGLQEQSSAQRAAAAGVLGLIQNDSHAAELAEKALKDPKAPVRAAAATALGQMHAKDADAALKQALNDKELTVVMAAAHALRLLNDPACYEVYYEVLTGKRKDNSSMIGQEMQVLRDPKQLAEMGFGEGIGFVPFASVGWETMQTIMKDKKSGTVARAGIISALATDPDPRTDDVLVKNTQNPRWVLRVAALEAIAKRGKPALRSAIQKSMDDPKYHVKYAAAATIAYLNDLAESQGAVRTSPSIDTQGAVAGGSSTMF